MMDPNNRFARTPDGFTAHILERNGCPLHYWTGGRQDGLMIACQHGALMDHRMFNAQVEALRDKYRLLVMDGRGHGLSQPFGEASTITDYVDDLLAVLDEQGVDRAVLLGQSMGGYVVQHTLRLHPKRVLGAAIIGSTPVALAVKGYEMTALRLSGTMFALWPYESLKRMMANNTALLPDTREYALDAIHQAGRGNLQKIWAVVNTAVRQEGYLDFYLEIPLLLTHGDQDRTGTIRRDSPIWAARDKKIQFEIIPNASHNANQDNPDAFNSILLDWLVREFETIRE